MRNEKKKFDFKPIGEVIKHERIRRKLSREEAAYQLDIDARYLTNIENRGQHPSIEVFSRLIRFFNISVDQYFLKHDHDFIKDSTERLHLYESLNKLTNNEIALVQHLVDGMLEQKGKHI